MSVEVETTKNTISLDGDPQHVIEVVESPSHSISISADQPNKLEITEQAPNNLHIRTLPHTLEMTEEKFFVTVVEGFREPQQINQLTDIPDVIGTPVLGSILEYDGTNWVATMADFELHFSDDSGDSTLKYVGKAAPGSVDAGSNWQIQRLTIVGTDIHIEWADGNNSFDNVWDDRESLSYS